MEPKFQSSFIPKGPIGSSATGSAIGQKGKSRSLLSYLSVVIFILSVVLAGAVFGYKFYLKYSLENMETALEQARADLQSETIAELTRLDNRLNFTKELVSKHKVLTPLFEFIEISTPKTVRFNNFNFSVNDDGVNLTLAGEARGYTALALAADIFNKSNFFINPVFSDLQLNNNGDVTFTFKGTIDSNQVLYSRQIEPLPPPALGPDADIVPSVNLELQ